MQCRLFVFKKHLNHSTNVRLKSFRLNVSYKLPTYRELLKDPVFWFRPRLCCAPMPNLWQIRFA